MALVRCKCGRYTQNGLLCTNCQKDSSIDILYYTPEDIEDEEELDELGIQIIENIEWYEEEDD
jgi:hypothetical protein